MATKPTYTPGQGGLALNRYDAQSHFNGTAFRHTADQIDLLTPILIGSQTFSNVETALAAVAGDLINEGSATQGFITVQDGYDCYHAANGTINFDSTIPSLDTLLNPIFAIMTAGGTLPADYQRLRDGGVFVIKSGTYTVRQTINIPPGITLMGEGFGTKIVNATSLSFATSPPHVSGTPAPVFNILPDTKRSQDDAAVDANVFMFARETRIQNMVIGDNFIEPTLLGDTSYLLPQNTTATTPLISQTAGSSLQLSNVALLGRVVFSSGTVVSSATSSAVGLNTTFSAPNGSILSIDRCFIDGFSVPVQFLSVGDSSAHVNRSFLTVVDSKIRAYGYLNGDGAVANPQNNSFVTANDNTTLISDNILYGNADNIASVLFVSSPTSGGAPPYGARAKATVQSNDITVNRASTLPNTTFTPLTFSTANFSTTFPSYVQPLVANNNFQNNVGSAVYQAITVATTTYTVGPNDHIIIPPTNTGAVTINLPAVTTSSNRELIIKDPGTASLTNTITLVASGTDVFENGTTHTYVVTSPYTALTIVALTYNSISSWFIV